MNKKEITRIDIGKSSSSKVDKTVITPSRVPVGPTVPAIWRELRLLRAFYKVQSALPDAESLQVVEPEAADDGADPGATQELLGYKMDDTIALASELADCE